MKCERSEVSGGCLCGSVRYASDEPPFRIGYCHCRMCQRGLGNLFGTAAFFRPEAFRFVAGEPQWYASSPPVRRGFCAQCGSPIAYQHRDVANSHIAIWTGTLDQPELYEPQVHWYTDSRISWVDIHADLTDATTDLASFRYRSGD